MYPSEPPRRSFEEDTAPTDWSYVQSVEEGLRKRQAQNIGDRSEPRIRHRAEPTQHAGEQAVTRSVLPAAGEDSPFILPTRAGRQGAAPAAPLHSSDGPGAAKPDFAPMAPQAASASDAPQPTRTRRRAQTVTEDVPQVEKPAEIQMPEWLRVAQQNTTPDSVRRPPAPRVQVAPPQEEPNGRPQYGRRSQPQQAPMRQADIYAAAGYPLELLAEQQRLDALQEAQMLRKRRGAMSVAPESQPQRQATANSYPPPRNAMPQRRALTPAEEAARNRAVQQYAPMGNTAAHRPSPATHPAWQNPYGPAINEQPYGIEEETEEGPHIRIPWLGILTSVLVLLAVFLWINRLNTGKELEKVYQARAAAQQQVVDEHPYHYRELIEAQAEQYNLHPAFVASIVLNESSFRPGVKSSADAMGLMQIRPDTGEYINRALDIPSYNHDMLYDPETNIRFGCYYLGELSERFGGDPVLVAAAYNAGPTNVQNWLNNSQYSSDRRTLPIENIPYGDTQTYARRVLRDYAAYKRLYYEHTEAPS